MPLNTKNNTVWPASWLSRVIAWCNYTVVQTMLPVVYFSPLQPPFLPYPRFLPVTSHKDRASDVEKKSTSLTWPLPSQLLLYTDLFSGYLTPWKVGDPVAHPTPLTQGPKTGWKKPFRCFSRRLVTWYSRTPHLSARIEEPGHKGSTS